MSKSILADSEGQQFLIEDVSSLIEDAKQHVALNFNSTTVLLYWSIGKRINETILNDSRAEYGEKVIANLAQQLTIKFGRGYAKESLLRMVRFAKMYGDYQIVSTLSTQLSWSHLMLVLPIEEELQREFYMQMAVAERWSVRKMQDKIKGMLYERTAISKQPDELIKSELKKLNDTGEVSPDLVFRDPYFLDFM